MSPPPTGQASPTAEVELAALLEVEVDFTVEVKLVERLMLEEEPEDLLLDELEPLDVLLDDEEVFFQLIDGMENDRLDGKETEGTETDGFSWSGSSGCSGTSTTSSGGVTTGLTCWMMTSIGMGIGMINFPLESVVAFLHVAVTWQVLQEMELLVEVIMPIVDQLVTGPLLELVVIDASGPEGLDLVTVFVVCVRVTGWSVEVISLVDVEVAVGAGACTP